MKRLKVRLNLRDNSIVDRNGNKYHGSDYKDIKGLLFNIDEELERHGLELCLGEQCDDSYWICTLKRKGDARC